MATIALAGTALAGGPIVTAVLELTRLTRRFGSLTAVDGLDLRIAVGARHALIGPNGAGKTTLLNLVAGTIAPSSGQITFAGWDVTNASTARRARLGLARTFQAPAVCDSLTVLENVVTGALPHTRRGWLPGRWRSATDRAVPQLAALGLLPYADVQAGRLAHGQRRLLEIGVALVARPRLLLLDEPAAGLTDTEVPHLLAALREVPAEQSIVLVEHQLEVVAALASTVTVLHQGRVLASGSPAEVTADPAVAGVYLGGAHATSI